MLELAQFSHIVQTWNYARAIFWEWLSSHRLLHSNGITQKFLKIWMIGAVTIPQNPIAYVIVDTNYVKLLVGASATILRVCRRSSWANLALTSSCKNCLWCQQIWICTNSNLYAKVDPVCCLVYNRLLKEKRWVLLMRCVGGKIPKPIRVECMLITMLVTKSGSVSGHVTGHFASEVVI